MREFAKVSPLFWTRGSGKRLRGNVDAQLVGLYLLTAPGANMIGVFYVPIVTIGHETGLGEARTVAALRALEEAGFAFYDAAGELAWVPNMAEIGIGEKLKAADNRRAGVLAELERLRGHRFAAEFWRRYGDGYQLGEMPPELVARLSDGTGKPLGRASEGVGPAASHPLQVVEGGGGKRREGEEKEKERHPSEGGPSSGDPTVIVVMGEPPVSPASVAPPPMLHVVAPAAEEKPSKASKRGTRLPEHWSPSCAVIEWARKQGIADPTGPLEEFRDFWISRTGKDAVRADWDAVYRNRLRELLDRGRIMIDESLAGDARKPAEDAEPLVPMPAKVAERLGGLFASAAEKAGGR